MPEGKEICKQEKEKGGTEALGGAWSPGFCAPAWGKSPLRDFRLPGFSQPVDMPEADIGCLTHTFCPPLTPRNSAMFLWTNYKLGKEGLDYQSFLIIPCTSANSKGFYVAQLSLTQPCVCVCVC